MPRSWSLNKYTLGTGCFSVKQCVSLSASQHLHDVKRLTCILTGEIKNNCKRHNVLLRLNLQHYTVMDGSEAARYPYHPSPVHCQHKIVVSGPVALSSGHTIDGRIISKLCFCYFYNLAVCCGIELYSSMQPVVSHPALCITL